MRGRATDARSLGMMAVLLLVLLQPTSGGQTPHGGWPGWMGLGRDGHSPDESLLAEWPEGGPTLLWKNTTLGGGWASVAVIDGRIYTSGHHQQKQMLLCLDLDGKEVWRVEQGPECSHRKYKAARSTPTVDGQRIFVTGGEGLVTCHDASDGSIIWSRDMVKEMGGKHSGYYFSESVLIQDDLAIVSPGGRNAVVALDKTTGQTVWASDASSITAAYSSCIAISEGGSTLIVNGTRSGLLVVDARTGEAVWQHPFGKNGGNVPTPTYAHGHLVWAFGYSRGSICFRVTHADGQWTFEEAWSSEDVMRNGANPGNHIIAGGCVYGVSRRGGLACVDLKTGALKWSHRDIRTCQLAWADGMLYVLSAKGEVSLVRPEETGPVLAGAFEIAGEDRCWAPPVVIGGRLYLRYDANLYCFDVRRTDGN